MKRILFLLLFISMNIHQIFSQVKTEDSNDYCSVRGIKFGYIYTVDQIKKAFGEPYRINCFPANDFGNNYEFYYKDGFTLRMTDDPRELFPGVLCFIITSNKYVLEYHGITLTVGDPFDKVKQIPGFTSVEERSHNFFVIFLNGNNHDESLRILPDANGKIEVINFEARYY